MTLPVEDLHRMAYNTLQYCSKKSEAGPVVEWNFNSSGIWLISSDDYVLLVSAYRGGEGWGYEDEIGESFYIDITDMKTIEKALREWERVDVTVEISDGELNLDGVSVGNLQDCPDKLGWGWAAKTLSMREFRDGEGDSTIFAIHPDRLRKLSLLKPGDFPIDCRYGYDTGLGRDIIHFRAGPLTRGSIAPLDRKIISESIREKGALW